MSTVLAKNIIDQLKRMNFSGYLISSLMGEPLLHPNFKEIIEYSIESGIKTNVISNFLLAQEKISINELLNIGINRLALSYQAPDETTFLKRKANVPFEIYFNKLLDILNFTKNNTVNTRRIEIDILHSFYNYLNVEIVNDYSFLKSTVEKLFSVIYSDNLTPSHKQIISSYIKKFSRGKQYLDSFVIEIKEGLYITLKRANTWANNLIPMECIVIPQNKGHCGLFNSTLGILWDGNCTVCCQDFNWNINIGNARLNTIEEIWNGDKLNYFREMEKKGLLINPYCQICRGKIKRNNKTFLMIKKQSITNKIFQLANRLKIKIK